MPIRTPAEVLNSSVIDQRFRSAFPERVCPTDGFWCPVRDSHGDSDYWHRGDATIEDHASSLRKLPTVQNGFLRSPDPNLRQNFLFGVSERPHNSAETR